MKLKEFKMKTNTEKVKMVWYKHPTLATRQYCAAGTLDNFPEWTRVGRIQLFLENIITKIDRASSPLPYQA